MHLAQQSLRDLCWLLTANPMLGTGLSQPPAAWLEAAFTASLPVIEATDEDPADFLHWLDHRPGLNGPRYRVGRKAEAVLAWWLSHRPNSELLADGLTIGDDDRTIGELDLVFRDAERGVVHWEVAVKYVLRDAHADDLDDFRGPLATDLFGDKVRKLRDQQLNLGHHPAAQAVLGDHAQPQMNEALLRGWLFHPAESDWQQPTRLPHAVHPDHPRGWWLRHGHGEVPCAARSSRFLVLDRSQWMAPAHVPGDATFRAMAANELRGLLSTHFDGGYEPLLIAEVRRDEIGWWRESARGFVVHANWPVEARERRLRGKGGSRHSAARSR